MLNYKHLLRPIPTAILGSFIINVVLLIILFVFDQPIKYSFYIFGATLTGIFILLSSRSDYKFMLTTKASYIKLVDYFLVGCSTVVFIYNAFDQPRIDVLLPLSIVLTFFLPGWVLLRLVSVTDKRMSAFSFIPLSFVTSIGLTSLILMLVLHFKQDAVILLSGIYAIISLFPMLKDKIQKFKQKIQPSIFDHQNQHNISNIIVLLWVTIFFVFIISSLYPKISDVPSLDIVRHLSLSKVLAQTPDIYSSEYVWFHSPLAVINELSGPSTLLFQYTIAFLSIILVFSFYVMAKAYLSDINKRAHLVATLFFFVFSGFGWIYVLQQKLSSTTSAIFDILNKSNSISYFDIGYGQSGWLWLWFRPITLGFTLFFMLLYLMRCNELTRRKYIIITSLLLLTLSQVHFPEFFVFVALIFILSLVRPTINLRILDTAISVLIAVTASVILSASYQILFNSEYQQSSFQYLLLLGIAAFVTCCFVKYKKRPEKNIRINSVIISSIILFVFSIFLIYWILNPDNFLILQTTQFYEVPWQFYPVLLGAIGVIAIFGTVIVLRKYRDHPIVTFVVLLVLAIIIGRIISYVNINFFDTGYLERRIIPFIFVGCSILAALFVSKFLNWQNLQKSSNIIKNILTVGFLSLLVIGGLLSLFFSVEYQILSIPKIMLTEDETKLVSYLSKTSPYSDLLTVTDRSLDIAYYGSVGYVIDYYRYQIWPSQSPELPLNVFSALNSSTIIFLNNADSKKISSDYKNGYIASHLLKVSPIIYEGSEGKVLEVPQISSPSNHSDMVLVLPEIQKNAYYAYDILSLSRYNYTTAIEDDVNFLSNAKIIVAPTEDIAMKMMNYKKESNFQFKKLIILNAGDNSTLLNAISNASNTQEIPEGQNSTITSKTYDSYDLFYLDIRPIIQKLNSGDTNAQKIFVSLGKILQSTHIQFPIYEIEKRSSHSLVTGGVIVFQNATYKGELVLKSPSAIINVDSSPLSITTDGNNSNFKDVSKIIPIETDNTTINSNGGIISGGTGFYTHAFFNQSSIEINGHPSTLLLSYENGSTNTIKGDQIKINLEKSDVLIRQPTIKSKGSIGFTSFYSYGEINKKLRSINQGLKVDGNVSYDVRYADNFTIAHNGLFNGAISYSKPISSFNEIATFMDIFTIQNIPYVAITAIVLAIGSMLILRRKTTTLEDKGCVIT